MDETLNQRRYVAPTSSSSLQRILPKCSARPTYKPACIGSWMGPT